MTREETIEQLQNCKLLIKQDGKDWLDERDIPLLDMAIEALKENNTADSLLNSVSGNLKERECKLSREDARFFLQGISDMFSLSPEAEIAIDMAIESLQNEETFKTQLANCHREILRLLDFSDMTESPNDAVERPIVDKCDGCLYEDSDKSLFPCAYCKRNHFDKYEKDESNNITESQNDVVESKDDVIEVVRCKDCRYLDVWNLKNIYAVCSKHNITFEPFEDDTRTHFCAWGENAEQTDKYPWETIPCEEHYKMPFEDEVNEALEKLRIRPKEECDEND